MDRARRSRGTAGEGLSCARNEGAASLVSREDGRSPVVSRARLLSALKSSRESPRTRVCWGCAKDPIGFRDCVSVCVCVEEAGERGAAEEGRGERSKGVVLRDFFSGSPRPRRCQHQTTLNVPRAKQTAHVSTLVHLDQRQRARPLRARTTPLTTTRSLSHPNVVLHPRLQPIPPPRCGEHLDRGAPNASGERSRAGRRPPRRPDAPGRRVVESNSSKRARTTTQPRRSSLARGPQRA